MKEKTTQCNCGYPDDKIPHSCEPICSVCGIQVIFNLDIYERTGMCGTCTTGEARLNYEED